MPAAAMPKGPRYGGGVCHTNCSSSSFLTAASVSFTPLRSFLPHSLDSATLQPLHSSSIHFSRVHSTRCQLLCSPAAPLGLRSPCDCYCSCSTSRSQSIAKPHLHSSATSVPFGKYTPVASYGAVLRPAVSSPACPAPMWGLAVRLRFVVPPHSGGRLTARKPP